MPYKEKIKQQKYMKGYMTEYMRKYRRRKVQVDSDSLGEVKKQFPEAYKLLSGDSSRDISQEIDRLVKQEVDNEIKKGVLAEPSPNQSSVAQEEQMELLSQEGKNNFTLSEFKKINPKIAKNLQADGDFAAEGKYVFFLLSAKQKEPRVLFIKRESIAKTISKLFQAR